MTFQSLYRRYRPRRFGDVRGQEHVITALRNAVREDRVGHAYLFSGPRGTGKTSTARILAKALNCEHLVEGEPDGTCASCLAIDAGTSYDVQELDAASNNGVNDVRDLIGRVNLGSPGRTKVYILDEVHMLTAQASAALLKTLEEPPDHVVFVLATTDPQKVLPTIRSRTQHYDFHLLSADELSKHVAWVIDDAGLDLDDDVIEHVVRMGAGSARDTLSALDQVAAAGGVLETSQPVDDLLDAVAVGDTGAALVAVAHALALGRDPRVLGETLLARLRDVFLVRMGGAVDHLAPAEVDAVRAWASQLGDRATTRALEVLGEALVEMRQAPDPRIPLEVALVKITRTGSDPSIEALAERVAALEAALASGGTPSAAVASPQPVAAAPAPAPPSASAARPASPSVATATERPKPPPARPGSRPADSARAALAAQRGKPAAPPSSPSPSDPVPSDRASGPSTGEPPARPTTDSAPQRAPEPGAGPEPQRPSPSVALSIDALNAVWDDDSLGLRGLALATFRQGTFTALEGGTATLQFENQIYCDKGESRRAEVEAALSARFGTAVTLRLTVDGSAPAMGSPAPPSPSDPDPADDLDLSVADVRDLPDAPAPAAGGLEALTQAFPGAELIE